MRFRRILLARKFDPIGKIAKECLLNNPLIALYTVENITSVKLYTVYLAEISPTARLGSHKYGVTSQIWCRIIGLREHNKISRLLKLFVFFDKTSAYDFEKWIKDFVWKCEYAKNFNCESVTIPQAEFANFVNVLVEKYMQYVESDMNLFAACKKFIMRVNVHIISQAIIPRRHPLIYQQDLMTDNKLLPSTKKKSANRRKTKSLSNINDIKIAKIKKPRNIV